LGKAGLGLDAELIAAWRPEIELRTEGGDEGLVVVAVGFRTTGRTAGPGEPGPGVP